MRYFRTASNTNTLYKAKTIKRKRQTFSKIFS